MEFKIFRNIENGFKQIRMYAIAFAVLCSGVSIFAVGYAYYFAEKQREKIYVLDNGKSLMLALSQDEKINRPVEAKEHVRRFHELFFNLAPIKKQLKTIPNVPSLWLINLPLTTIKIWLQKAITTASSLVISSNG